MVARLSLGVLAALVLALSLFASPVHADIAASIPDGCVVVDITTLPPTTCSFTSLGSDPVEVLLLGNGTVSVTTTSGGACTNLLLSSTNVLTPLFPLGGCNYTVSMTGAGTAAVVDPNASQWGECAGLTGSCSYDNVLGTGVAFAEAVVAVPSTLTLNISDDTSGTPVLVKTCNASGVASLTAECTYAETPSHFYLVNATVSSATAAGPIVIAAG
jgi:hypothetical protein